MAFVDRVIYELSDTSPGAYHQDVSVAIKEHIQALMNAKSQHDCSSLCDLDLNAKNLAHAMSEYIYKIISTYEHRARVLHIGYDETLIPWQLSFFVRLCHSHDHFREFDVRIVFRNNRYCEVL